MNCKQSILSAAIVASLGFAAQLHAQEADTGDQAKKEKVTDIETVTVVGIRGSLETSLDAKRDADSARRGRQRRGHRQAARQERRRHPAAPARRQHQFVERHRRRLRRSRPRQPARHQPQPHPDADQRPYRGHRRLVRARARCRPWVAASATPCCRRKSSARWSCTRPRRPSCAEGGSAGSVDIITRRPLQFADAFTGEAHRRRGVFRPARQYQAAVRRAAQLEERRQHRRHPVPGVLREAQPAPRRPGSGGRLRADRSRLPPAAIAQPGSRRRAVSRTSSARRSSNRRASARAACSTSSSSPSTT